MVDTIESTWISGFWRRIGAMSIDLLLLGIAGFALGVVLENTFVQAGAWGRLIGFSIALIYFGVMNSSMAGGQTIGKRTLKLRVVDCNNSPISVGKSLLRYCVLATPFFLNGTQFSNDVLFSYLMYPLSMIIFGGTISILYLYIFNRLTRQSLHDLAVGTFIVHANAVKQEVGSIRRFHLSIVLLIFLAAGILPFFTKNLAQTGPFNDMLAVQMALTREPNITYATIFSGSSTFHATNKETKTTTYVRTQVFLDNNNISDAEFARHIMSIVIANYPEALQKDSIQVTLTYGYDIGISSRWYNHTHTFDPKEIRTTP